MRRAERLFEIVEILRRAKGPLTAQAIAEKLETGRRTIYRDLAALMSRRVPIRGEAGIGYVLDREYDMPPLMLTPIEIEAVVLGSQWVMANADPELSKSAENLLAKVAAVVPKRLREMIDGPVVATPVQRRNRAVGKVDMARLREWTRKEQKLRIRYTDDAGARSTRIVWPILVGYVGALHSLIGWCELRRDFRVFRMDRLIAADFLEERYPEDRSALRRRWMDSLKREEQADAARRSPAPRE